MKNSRYSFQKKEKTEKNETTQKENVKIKYIIIFHFLSIVFRTNSKKK